MPATLERRVGLLLEYFRSQRALLVLDNLESLLEEGEGMGRMRAGYQDYEQLLRRVAQTEHQSCLLLTSREKPRGLAALEGSHTPVRALRLSGLDAMASEQLLLEKDVAGTTPDRQRLMERYGRQPAGPQNRGGDHRGALRWSRLRRFLSTTRWSLAVCASFLDEQFARLSLIEQTVLLWLAILREPVSIEELLTALATPLTRAQVLEAVEALRRRSLIERGKRRGSFTLQSVVLEYATGQLIAEAANEIEHGRLARLIEHRLAPANAKEYVRQTQQRLIVAPLLAQVRHVYRGREEVEEHLLSLLDEFRQLADYAPGLWTGQRDLACCASSAGTCVAGSLAPGHSGVDRQGVEMQDTSLSGRALLRVRLDLRLRCHLAVAISPKVGAVLGRGWQAGGGAVWREGGRGHPDPSPGVAGTYGTVAYALAFSPDGGHLPRDAGTARQAVGSRRVPPALVELAAQWYPTPDHGPGWTAGSPSAAKMRLFGFWGREIWHPLPEVPGRSARCFRGRSPDGRLFASADIDARIRLWDVPTGARPAS